MPAIDDDSVRRNGNDGSLASSDAEDSSTDEDGAGMAGGGKQCSCGRHHFTSLLAL